MNLYLIHQDYWWSQQESNTFFFTLLFLPPNDHNVLIIKRKVIRKQTKDFHQVFSDNLTFIPLGSPFRI